MISVYQNHATNRLHDEVNALGWDGACEKYPEVEAHLKASRGVRGWKPEYGKYYDYVAAVDTDDLEEAFEIMNISHDSPKLEKVSRFHSMSVGDLVCLNREKWFICDHVGFEEIEVKL